MRLTSTDTEFSPEEKLKKIQTQFISDRINLYIDLKRTCGEEQGTQIYKTLYYEGIKRIRANFPNGKISVGELMKRELKSFPLMGFDLFIDHKIENGEDVYYEHITKCPALDASIKMGIKELPCDFICAYDMEIANRDKRGKWQMLSKMGSGDQECLFRIRECE